MEYLPLQVGEIHRVAVTQHDGADAGCSQIQRGRRTQATGADHQGTRIDQPFLPLDSDLVEQDVTAVAQKLVVGHFGAVSGQAVTSDE